MRQTALACSFLLNQAPSWYSATGKQVRPFHVKAVRTKPLPYRPPIFSGVPSPIRSSARSLQPEDQGVALRLR